MSPSFNEIPLNIKVRSKNYDLNEDFIATLN